MYHLYVASTPSSNARVVVELTTKGNRGREDFKALVRDIAFEYANQVDEDCGYFRKAMQPDDCEQFVQGLFWCFVFRFPDAITAYFFQ